MWGTHWTETQIRQASNSKIVIASKSLQGSHSTTTKNALYTTKRTKVRTVQKYNRRWHKVHTKMRPNTEPNKGIHNQPITSPNLYILIVTVLTSPPHPCKILL